MEIHIFFFLLKINKFTICNKINTISNYDNYINLTERHWSGKLSSERTLQMSFKGEQMVVLF
jgi:hypothetical protein